MKQPTTWTQTTVDEIGRIIVPPEPFVRRVRLVIPDNAFVELHLFRDEAALARVFDASGKPIDADITSQDSLSPLAPPDVIIPLEIAPGQSIMGRTREQQCDLSVIVEYP